MNKWRGFSLIICVALGVLGLAALLTFVVDARPAGAAAALALTVTNTNDGGPGSLRQAIADAGPGDSIDFALAYPATITLTSGELLITRPLTITGPGPELLAVSGDHTSRVFRVDDPAGAGQITVTLSGLTIRDGQVEFPKDGGGLWNDENLTLTDVTFRGNSASHGGGGMYTEYSNPALTDVTFRGNSADYGGGGMYNNDSSPTLARVTIRDNSAGNGGGMYNWKYSSPTLMDVTFNGNSAGRAGGMYNDWYSSPTLTHVTFSRNLTNLEGGGMYNDWYSNPTLTDATFSSNSARSGGGISNRISSPTLTNVTFRGNSAGHNGGGMQNYNESNPTIQNSILWDNRAASAGDQIYNGRSTPAIAYSDVEGSGGSGSGWKPGLGTDMGGNLDGDPLFVDTGSLRLRWGSPAVDAGDNSLVPPGVTTDLDGAPRFTYGTVDMGAYELQPGLYLYKDAGLAGAVPGQRLTYTLQAANTFTATAMTGGLLSDTLPAGLVFSGPITLDPPGAGLVGTAPPILVSDLTLSPAQIVTVTFPVTVAPDLVAFTILTNTAAVTSSQVLTPQLASHTIVVVGYLYLPVIFKGGEP